MRVAGVADIGGTHTRIALVLEDFTIFCKEDFNTPRGSDPYAISTLIRTVLTRYCESYPDIKFEGIGVSVAGPVDMSAGSIKNPPNMPFNDVPIVGPLSDTFGCPVVLMNDCRAAVLGEVAVGAGKGYDNVVYITISTGIGGGVYTNGEILLGRGGNAGEIGHFTVDTLFLQPCSCKGTGHWEGCASGRCIPHFFQTWCVHERISPSFPHKTAEEILIAASQDKPHMNEFIETLARINARGLSTVVVAYDPDIIILDGPVVINHKELILDRALPYIDSYLDRPKIVISPLMGNAPIYGVAEKVFSSLYNKSDNPDKRAGLSYDK